MRLYFYRAQHPNFGDELNLTMWQHLLPDGFFDDAEEELFLGIGSILFDTHPKAPKKIVAGSGWGYATPPNVHDGNWEILFLRGPRTAEVLGVDPKFAIGDAAILLRETPLPDPKPGIGAAFMPHFDSVERGNWAKVCQLAGLTYIDPTDDVDHILATIRGADVVVTEAMHGAIVADALRTPWVAMRPIAPAHRMKWQDWAGALQIDLRMQALPASNLREAWSSVSGMDARGRKSRAVMDGIFAAPGNRIFAHRAARILQRLAKAEPQLSEDHAIASATDRAMAAIDQFLRRRQTHGAQKEVVTV